MSEDTVLTAYQTLLTGPLGLPAASVFTDLPDLPYRGGWPCFIIQPLNQSEGRASQGLVLQQGYYRIHYFDRLGVQSGKTRGQIMHGARVFAMALRRALRRDPRLQGAVEWAGDGRGIIARYSEAGPVSTELADQPLYLLCIDVDTLDAADLEEASYDLTGLLEAQYP